MESRKTLTVKELARELSIGLNAAYNLVNTEGFPALRIGTKIVVPVELLDDWIRENARENAQKNR